MPSYDFECRECGHRFTATVPMREREKVLCEKCRGEVKQLFTGFTLLKGSGGGSSCAAPAGSSFS